MAEIIPIVKSGDSTLMQNYRPICLLPFLSKIFERAIYNRLLDYLEKNSIISPCQFGFLPGKSTKMAIQNLTEYLYQQLNQEKISINIFIDGFCSSYNAGS